MVSKAREDFPDPDSPVITVRVLRGISMLMFFRLCWRAPRTTSLVRAIGRGLPPQEPARPRGRAPAPSNDTEARITFNKNSGALRGSRKLVYGVYGTCQFMKFWRYRKS